MRLLMLVRMHKSFWESCLSSPLELVLKAWSSQKRTAATRQQRFKAVSAVSTIMGTILSKLLWACS